MKTERAIVKAKDVMTQSFIRMDGMSTVQEAIDQMREHNVDVVLVNKRDQHDAFAILLLPDIAKHVLAKDRSPQRVNIYEIMSKPVVSVMPDMDVRYCARLFESFGLSNAPVIENEEILGLVGYRELVLHELDVMQSDAK